MADEQPDGNTVAFAIFQSLATVLNGGGERFLITNHSIRDLVTLYYKDFAEAAGRGYQGVVLENWLQNADYFTKQWLDVARQNEVVINEQKVLIVTEKATHEARERCKKEKQRSGGPARAR